MRGGFNNFQTKGGIVPHFKSLSWEIMRNASEIGMVLRNAILKQWLIPSITMEENTVVYDHDEKKTSFVVNSYKTSYKITIEEL
jgi:hypothetical protein